MYYLALCGKSMPTLALGGLTESKYLISNTESMANNLAESFLFLSTWYALTLQSFVHFFASIHHEPIILLALGQ